MRARISIAMATFNGSRFLGAQLESFLAQSRRPDELIIVDDNSTDDTLAIARRFAGLVSFPVTVQSNPVRLGYVRNFERAASLCSGDIICFSDQDDVWFPPKLASVEARFDADARCMLLINDVELTDSELVPSGIRQLVQLRYVGLSSDAFVMGAASSARRAFVQAAYPTPSPLDPFWTHDKWLHALGKALGCRRVLPAPLQYYRRHEAAATSGWSPSEAKKASFVEFAWTYASGNVREHLLRRALNLKDVLRWLEDHNRELIDLTGDSDRVLSASAHISAELEAVALRTRLLRRRRFFRAPGAVTLYAKGGYNHFSGWRSLLKDLIIR